MLMDPEARFLQNQEARTAAVRKHTKTNDVHAFWRDLRGKLAEWGNRLEQQKHECRTANERQLALQELETLQQELKAMQKDALAELELPVADLRLLHNEFASCAQQLQDARDVVCPPTRFVFARYRAAWKERMTTHGDEKVVEQEKEVKSKAFVTQGRTIQDLADAVIVEQEDGSVRVTSGGGKVDTLKLESIGSMSLVLQNLRHCQVSINARYQLLHLINLVDCIVTCSNRIEGAIHITACTDTTITGSCHQLRIHETKKLRCHVKVGSGPILEDSSDIFFYAAPGDSVIHETKDFNWFRSEPSPNFEIIEKALSDVPEVKQESRSDDSANAAPQHNESLVGTCQEDEDDEDEL